METQQGSEIDGSPYRPPERSIRIPLPRMPGRAALLPGALVLLALILGFYAVQRTRTTERQVKAIERRLDSLSSRVYSDTTGLARLFREFEIERVIEGYAPSIDLRSAQLASISESFSVGRLQVEAVPGGTRVSGLLVNGQAVNHRSAQFSLAIGEDSTTFTVMSLPAGGSARFSAVVTGANADSVRWGRFRYNHSTVSYRTP